MDFKSIFPAKCTLNFRCCQVHGGSLESFRIADIKQHWESRTMHPTCVVRVRKKGRINITYPFGGLFQRVVAKYFMPKLQPAPSLFCIFLRLLLSTSFAMKLQSLHRLIWKRYTGQLTIAWNSSSTSYSWWQFEHHCCTSTLLLLRASIVGRLEDRALQVKLRTFVGTLKSHAAFQLMPESAY